MKNLLYYFTETSPADAAGDAVLLPQSSFIRAGVANSTSLDLYFKKIDGTHDKSSIRITHAAGKTLEAMKVVLAAMAGNTRSNIIDFAEVGIQHPVSGVLAETTSLITNITITE